MGGASYAIDEPVLSEVGSAMDLDENGKVIL
jgi:hypothetical protein